MKFQFETSNYKREISRFQFETLNNTKSKGGHNIKYLPYAFTEQGIAMLSSVLKTEIAYKISINIMRTFVKMRKYLKDNIIEQAFINELVLKHEKDIRLLQETFDKLEESSY